MAEEISKDKKRLIISSIRMAILSYHIPFTATILAQWLNFTNIAMMELVALYATIMVSNFAILAAVLYDDPLKKTKAKLVTILLFANCLAIFVWWVSMLDAVRPIALMSAIIAYIFAFLYTSCSMAFILVALTSTCYLLGSYLGSMRGASMALFYYDVYLMYLFIPTSVFVVFMTNKVRTKQQAVRSFNQQLIAANKQITQAMFQVEELNKKLVHLTHTDDLTQLHNRRSLESLLNEEIENYQEAKQIFSLLVCDIDNFKHINDTYGHDLGDKVIQHVAKRLSSYIADTGFVARWGGEEFLVLLPRTVLTKALSTAESLRINIAKFEIPEIGEPVTVSIGVTEMQPNSDINSLFKLADEALYEAKQLGRNCVCHRSHEPEAVNSLL